MLFRSKDFVPITMALSIPDIVVVHPSLPVRSVRELIALAKARPGMLNSASGPVGTTPHLAGELFKHSQQLDLVHVPFAGSAPAVGAALAGHIPIAFTVITPAVPLVREGKIRALAVTTPKRSPALPDVPTLAEAGLPGQESDTMQGILVPAGTPKPIIDLLNREIVAIMELPDVKEKLVALGFETVASSPQEFADRIRNEIPKWAKVIKDAGIKTE